MTEAGGQFAGASALGWAALRPALPAREPGHTCPASRAASPDRKPEVTRRSNVDPPPIT